MACGRCAVEHATPPALVLSAHPRLPPVLLPQAAFLKRMLAVSAAAGDTGLAMGLLCVLQRMLRCVSMAGDIADSGIQACLPHAGV